MEELSATEGLALGLSRAFYALARTLRLNKLRDLIAAASLSVEAPLCLLGRSYSCSRYGSEEEVRLEAKQPACCMNSGLMRGKTATSLRRQLPPPAPAPSPARHRLPSCSVLMQALARLLDHFQSILWMSYRRGFKPIPAGGASLGSDVGWGCTLRR